MAIRRTTITVTGAAGGAGVATANATSTEVLNGYIMGVYLTYTDAPPAGTTDVTIAERYNSPAMAVLTVTDAATDGWFFPQAAAVSQAGAASGTYVPIPVSDYLKVTIAQANNNDGVTATVVWLEA